MDMEMTRTVIEKVQMSEIMSNTVFLKLIQSPLACYKYNLALDLI